jgi:hypothetical protein
MPTLVPTRPDDPAAEANRAAWEVLVAWEKPFLVAFSDLDPITGGMAPVLKKLVPGTSGLSTRSWSERDTSCRRTRETGWAESSLTS